MCGLAGYYGGAAWFSDTSAAYRILGSMTQAITHRGPDSDGAWIAAAGCVALGHRRLAILDLSPAGAQPMVSPSGRYTLVFNGEVYNHLEIRTELDRAGHGGSWRGHSDTESLLAGFDEWGIEATLSRSVGMFAMAVWDAAAKALTLIRDRLGEKPLYYGWQGSGDRRVLLFGSELKALRVHPAFAAAVDRNALASYLQFMSVPGAASIYEGIHKVLPGTLLTFHPGVETPVASTYWSAAGAFERGLADPFQGSADDAVDEVERLLLQSTAQQMIADVPLGAFLSGGIDSSTVVSLMQQQSTRRVKTFTIGFHEERYDEAVYARDVASHLGTEHTELYVTPDDALRVIPRLPSMYDEPFCDSSQIPTYLVSAMAGKHVTVCLSGDGGDELFGGYTRYLATNAAWRGMKFVPAAMREVLARLASSVAPDTWDKLLSGTPFGRRLSHPGDKIHKAAALLSSRDVGQLYAGMISTWRKPSEVVREVGIESTGTSFRRSGSASDVERMMLADLEGYLPNDVLTKVDRAAMSVSLETRVPMLDHRLVEFAWRLPLSYKIRKVEGRQISKWPIREILHRRVPKSLIDRPKMGFGVPIHAWLRGPLKEWADDLLSTDRLNRDGYFHAAPIRAKWIEHQSGRRNWQAQLWAVLMFQSWMDSVRG